MKKYVLTSTAKGDVRDILDFLKIESPTATVRVRTALRDAMRFLAERPGAGHVRTPPEVALDLLSPLAHERDIMSQSDDRKRLEGCDLWTKRPRRMSSLSAEGDIY